MEAYADDLIVKSLLRESHLKDLEECFATLRKYNMKLNPDKCTFALDARKFLGFLVSNRGIKANPEKIMAIMDMQPPKTIKDVQKLSGRLVPLHSKIGRQVPAILQHPEGCNEIKGNNLERRMSKSFRRSQTVSLIATIASGSSTNGAVVSIPLSYRQSL